METRGLWIFSAKCDVILRFRRICFNMPQGFMRKPRKLDLGIGLHTCTAKMSARGGWSVCTIRVLLECAYSFFN